MSRSRFLPPAAGGAQKTGWEALEKHVASGDAAPAGGPSGKTGWEALEKHVSSEPGGGSPTQKAPSASGGGFMGWLKRVFGGG